MHLEGAQGTQIGNFNVQVNFWGGRPQRAALGLGGLGVVAALGLTGIALQVGGWQAEASLPQLAAVVVAVLVGIGLVRVRIRRGARASAGELAAAKSELASLVTKQWKPEARRRDLNEPRLVMPVLWRARAGAAFEGTSREASSLAAQFKELWPRRLVILGGPGAGKTTLAIQLLLELLAQLTPSDPVPVLLSLTEWNPQATPEFRDWLTGQVARDYPPLGTEVAASLVAEGAILPILDGLDELPDAIRPQVITAVNRALNEDDQLILTSRTQEYDQAEASGRELSANAVIEPEPLSPGVAAGYLRNRSRRPPTPDWGRVLAALEGPEPPATLAAVITTPLGLWLVRETSALRNGDPADLLDDGEFDTPAALRGHLFDLLIPALIEARKPGSGEEGTFLPRRAYRPALVRRWLESLARYLDDPAQQWSTVQMIRLSPGSGLSVIVSRGFRWLRLGAATLPRRLTPAICAAIGAVLGGAFGIIAYAGLASGAVTASGFTTGTGTLVAATVTWAVVGALAGLWSSAYVNQDSPYRVPGATGRPLWGRLARDLAGGGLLGAAFGACFGFIAWLVYRAWSAIAGSAPPRWTAFLIGGPRLRADVLGTMQWSVLLGLVAGIVVWASIDHPPAGDVTPYASWRATRDIAAIRVAVITAVAAGWGAVGSVIAGHRGAAGFEAAVWGIIGLAFSLLTGDRTWLVFLVATGYEARGGRLPVRLMPFLDDAHRLGLLRTVGPVYQFRHAELQDHLAAPRRQAEALAAVALEASGAGAPPAARRPRWGTLASICAGGALGYGIVGFLSHVGDLSPAGLVVYATATVAGAGALLAEPIWSRYRSRR